MTKANDREHVFKKLRLTLCSVLLFLSLGHNLAAQCVIQSNNSACVDEPFSFSIQSSSTVTGVAWAFGEGNTSNLVNPFHKFSKAGTFTVSAKVTLSGGGTCDATKTITVYNPPNVKLFLDKSNSYCLSQNKVCLIDSSTSGNTGVIISDRAVLWGDGGRTDTQNPKIGGSVCYNYGREGKFTLTIELVNEKGCKAKQEFPIEILKDFIPKFSSNFYAADCDSQVNVFRLDTSWTKKYASDIVRLEYDFKDGTKKTTQVGDSILHIFNKTGSYDVSLKVTLKNGCQTTFTQTVKVSLDRIEIKHTKLFGKRCYPEYFEFNHPKVDGATTNYFWVAYDTTFKPVDAFGTGNKTYFYPNTPGKYYISLRIERNNCVSYMRYDSVESIGVKAIARVFNGSQCEPKDTVYFCNKSVSYGTNDISYFWKYNDTSAQNCTTDFQKGLNLDKNCNFSIGPDGKHFYHNKKCDEALLVATDNKNGCKDSAAVNVIIGKPDLSVFKWKPLKMCLGSQTEYGVLLDLVSCFGDVMMNVDSACGRDKFETFTAKVQYLRTCDTSRWVTIGLAAKTGDPKVYRSCNPNDYYIDNDRLCLDTVWFHHLYKLEEPPFSPFNHKFDGCIPSTLSGSLLVRDQPNVRKMYFDWGDGSFDTIDIADGTAQLPDFKHVYRRSGIYKPKVILETDSGCVDEQDIVRQIGFYNNFLYNDLICPGKTIEFKDTITYWKDTVQYWRKLTNPEKIFWDWGGATGPTTGPEPMVTFDTTGTYTVRMISQDKTGCADTMIKKVVVTDVLAGIYDVNKKIICEDILQLLDSSFALINPKDSLVFYYWDFGDGKTPSYLKDPFHYYSGSGVFDVVHIVENTVGCRDTANTSIEIDGPIPHFDIVSDTVGCVPFTATFKNNSQKASEFIWFFGDNASSSNTLSTNSDSSVSFTYNRPGTYYIYLYAGDSVVNPDNGNKTYFCSQVFPDSSAFFRIFRKVIVLPIPKVDFIVDGSLCVNTDIKLIDKSDSIYSHYRWFWENDSITGYNPVQTIVVRDSGLLTINYKPLYTPMGPYQRACFDSISKTFKIHGNGVEFNFTKDEVCPTYHFTAESLPGSSLDWDFGHPASGKLNMATGNTSKHTYAPENGDFSVCVESTSKEGCIDTACRTVNSDHKFNLFIPNIITPNGDQLNDRYVIDIEGEDYYQLEIYNRWGERVYSSSTNYPEDSPLNWDGTVQGTLTNAPAGTYFYIFRFRESCVPGAEIEEYNGVITVVR